MAGVVGLLLPVLLSASVPEQQPLTVGKKERLLVIAPHPDDETLGAGGLIQRVIAGGGSVRVVLVTAGDGNVEAVVHETGLRQPRPAQYVAYGERRLKEARAAVRELGGRRVRLDLLGFPDGGLNPLLTAHWRRIHPERSPTTGASDPPYAEAVDPDITYDGADLRAQLVRLLREAQPTIVAVPDPFDRHPDHHAAGLFTLLAIHDWVDDSNTRPRTMPRLVAYLVHWPAWPPGWDATTASTAGAEAALELPTTLPPNPLARTVLALTAAEEAVKRAALAKHVSQQHAMASFLAAFVRRTEPFTVLTATDLRRIDRSIEHPRQRQARQGDRHVFRD